jgi:DNA polymerase (family X)
MNRKLIAHLLEECGTLLELQGANPFRCNAYRNAGRAIQQYDGDLEGVLERDELEKIRGIGKNMAEHVKEIVATGRLAYHYQLVETTPTGLVEMLGIPGFGSKRIKQVYDELQISTIDALRDAGLTGRLAELKGFGPKLVQKILEGIEYLAQARQRVLYPEAKEWADSLIEILSSMPQVQRISICGSLRRLAATIKDVDLVVASDDPEPILDRFTTMPGVLRITGRGDTKASIVLASGINADLRVVKPNEFAFALNYFTGSKAHNILMRGLAQDRGMRLNEYALLSDGKPIECKEEADLYAVFGMEMVPPELREDSGEIEAAFEKRLPNLVEEKNLNGVFHCHTNASDGTATLDEMAAAAQSLGYQFLGIADHSRTAAYAGGLSVEKLMNQRREIDAFNEAHPDFTLFAGTESDILPDGSLDYDDEVLSSLDYVVASVHSQFNLPMEAMTERICKAIRHPACTMLGHATGRLLLRREAYAVDVEQVLVEAAKHGVWVEINANPNRLDLDWTWCKRAKALGVGIVINPDAHSTRGLTDTVYGVHVARRGWLEAGDLLNTKSVDEIKKHFLERKARVVT